MEEARRQDCRAEEAQENGCRDEVVAQLLFLLGLAAPPEARKHFTEFTEKGREIHYDQALKHLAQFAEKGDRYAMIKSAMSPDTN